MRGKGRAVGDGRDTGSACFAIGCGLPGYGSSVSGTWCGGFCSVACAAEGAELAAVFCNIGDGRLLVGS